MSGQPTSFAGWLETPAAFGLDWLDQRRAAAREQAGRQESPGRHQEGWRYTSLKALEQARFLPCVEALEAVQPEDIEDLLIPDLEAERAVLVNGRYSESLSSLSGLPGGVCAGSLRTLAATQPQALADLTQVAGEGAHLFSVLNTAGMADGLVLRVPAHRILERPLELLHVSVGMDGPRVAQPRHLIVLEAGARAQLIERHVALGESLYCTNSVMEVRLGEGAYLEHSRVQRESSRAFHLSGFYLDQASHSHYRGTHLGLGAAWARTDLVTRFGAAQARCDLSGLYLAGDGQLMDVHLDIAHQAPACLSRENFKGILYGKGRAVFDGRIQVAAGAQQTDARLSNKNLLLSREAEVDTKPQLEIYANDIKCSHGTTVGQIEPEKLFYLRSRGISAHLARRMLCLGFASEILDGIEVEPLRRALAEQVAHSLHQAPAEGENRA